MNIIKKLKKARRRAVSGNVTRPTGRLPALPLPAEEKKKATDGIIRLQQEDVQVSAELTEAHATGSWARPGSVALTIFIFSLLFILIIFLLIGQE